MLEYDVNLIILVENKTQPSTDNNVVAPSYEEWIFKVKPEGFIEPKTTTIKMGYKCPWEKEIAKKIEFKVVTKVKS